MVIVLDSASKGNVTRIFLADILLKVVDMGVFFKKKKRRK